LKKPNKRRDITFKRPPKGGRGANQSHEGGTKRGLTKGKIIRSGFGKGGGGMKFRGPRDQGKLRN